MVKKLAALAGAGALLLAVAGPALAYTGWSWGSKDVAVVNNNSATAVANTGGNGQGNSVAVNKAGADDVTVTGNNSLTTGDADAYAGALVVANTHIGCGPCASGGFNHKDIAIVKNNSAYANANSGTNGQGNGVTVRKAHADDIVVSGDNTTTTGNARSTARAWVVVNTHWTGGYYSPVED